MFFFCEIRNWCSPWSIEVAYAIDISSLVLRPVRRRRTNIMYACCTVARGHWRASPPPQKKQKHKDVMEVLPLSSPCSSFPFAVFLGVVNRRRTYYSFLFCCCGPRGAGEPKMNSNNNKNIHQHLFEFGYLPAGSGPNTYGSST